MAEKIQTTRPSSKTRRPVQESAGGEAFRIEKHGDVDVVIPSDAIEHLHLELIEQAAELLTTPLTRGESPLVIFDLVEVDYFGSLFLSLLLRTYREIHARGGTMVLCNVSERARELLKLTSMDTLWAIYRDRDEAMEALSGE